MNLPINSRVKALKAATTLLAVSAAFFSINVHANDPDRHVVVDNYTDGPLAALYALQLSTGDVIDPIWPVLLPPNHWRTVDFDNGYGGCRYALVAKMKNGDLVDGGVIDACTAMRFRITFDGSTYYTSVE